MKLRYAAVSGLLLATLALAEQEAPVANGTPRAEGVEAATLRMDALFARLIEQALQIDRLLNEVVDKESADHTAPELEQKLALMGEKLRELEALPFRDAQDAEALKVHMAALTHVSQSYLSTMLRLTEVNTYGSGELMTVFQRYKVDDHRLTQQQSDDLPHTLLCSELADSLEDALLALNKVQDAASAAQTIPILQTLLTRIERTHHMLTLLAPPQTDEQKESLRPARERLLKISNELKRQNDRLQAQQCFHCRELDLILPRLLQLAAS